MRKTESKLFDDGTKITTTQHPCTDALLLGTKLLPIALPIVAQLESLQGLTMDSEVPVAVLVPMARDFLSELAKQDAIHLVVDLFKHSVVDFVRDGKKVNMHLGDKSVIDEALSLQTLLHAVIFTVQVNYKNFFPDGAMTLDAVAAPSQKAASH